MIIWQIPHFKNNSNRKKEVEIVIIPSWIWLSSWPSWRWKVEVFLIQREFEDRPLLSSPPSLFGFSNRTIIFFHVEIHCNCASHILIAEHNEEHMNSSKGSKTFPRWPKPFPAAWPEHHILEHHTSAHQVMLQLRPPPTHEDTRCPETTGSRQQCCTLLSQLIL